MRKATNKNWQRVTAAAAALALCAGVLTGCGASSSTAAGSTAASSAAASEVSSEEADEMAAKNVADLIDAIYVQERNENTDEQCKAAKDAWDALTDAQKELVRSFAIPCPTRQVVLLTNKNFIRHTLLEVLVKEIKLSVPKEMLSLKATQAVV